MLAAATALCLTAAFVTMHSSSSRSPLGMSASRAGTRAATGTSSMAMWMGAAPSSSSSFSSPAALSLPPLALLPSSSSRRGGEVRMCADVKESAPPKAAADSSGGSSSSQATSTTGKQAAKQDRLMARMSRDMEQNKPGANPEAAAVKSSARFNRAEGRDRYNPQTYFELIDDATQAVKDAMNDGVKRMEVELAALGQETYTYRADTFVDVNAALATALGAGLAGEGKRVRILLPDKAEVSRQKIMLERNMGKRMKEEMGVLADKLVFGSLTEAAPSVDEKIGSAFSSIFTGGKYKAPAPPSNPEDVFIVINVGVQDLPLVEKYYEKIADGKTMILMNCELDTLRGDLGLPVFPSKDLHYRFLSFFKPVFYLRNRKYAKTQATPPYNIEYGGSLFRDYPGPWQVMLKLGDGSLACVAESPERYYLNEAKYQMAEALGIAEEKGSVMDFLRTGYKAGTWWEEGEEQELSNLWRT
eukprot:CAMPEP_0197519356 /NCGR_PEP_ID=MMETSP1318-20131121/4618_1 /TAXON_ID=552666 /ORGANISM="Partenskyella glossopodia, Strain RCC365" /LENGTH=472 /DNA_ID=CAMNT_0043070277 /DNA_START=116 /DNA_END=1531 /DNA_ORIENTATION=-